MTRRVSKARRAAIPWAVVAIAVAALAALTACAGSKRDAAEATVRYEARGPGASLYQTRAQEGAALRGPHAFRIGQGIEQAITSVADKPRPDARLSLLSQWVIDAYAEDGDVPGGAVLDFWAHHLGMVEPVPEIVAHVTGDPARLPQLVESSVRSSIGRRTITHYGGASMEREGATFSVVALSQRLVHLKDLPRELPAGQPIALSGKLAAGLDDPRLVVVLPDGSSHRDGRQSGEGFVYETPTARAGEYRVELLADSPDGVTVVANFPVYAGVPAPTSIEIKSPAGATDESNEAVEERLFELANEVRSRVGVPPLQLDDRLGRVARSHSRDMRDHGFFGHTSPRTGEAADRVAAARIEASVVQENLGRGRNAEEIHAGLMGSPGHRDNLLSPEATHVGIGVVSEPESEHTAFLATQLFIRSVAPIDIDDAPDEVLDAINRARTKRGIGALAGDDRLHELAQTAATRFFKHPHRRESEVLSEASTAATRLDEYGKIGAVLSLTFSLAQVAKVEAALDRKARAVGIGVAEGSRSDVAAGRIAVVLILGY